MKKLICLALLLGFSIGHAQNRIAYADTTQYYSFSVNYWFNMHHFLWLEAFMTSKMDSTILQPSIDTDGQSSLQKALTYYQEKLVDEDLRMSDYQSDFKQWITSDMTNLEEIPEQFKEQMEVLTAFSPTYQRLFWGNHLQRCKEVLSANLPMIRRTEAAFVDGITLLTRQFWDEPKIKVDVTVYAKATTWNLRNRPYTSVFPTHVVMNVYGEDKVLGNWLELLFHESAHHLIFSRSYFIGGTIQDVAAVHQLKIPRQLWHAVLFYFTGALSISLLEEQGVSYPTTYMERNQVFSRYHETLEKHLSRYMEKEITFSSAIEAIMRELNEKK